MKNRKKIFIITLISLLSIYILLFFFKKNEHKNSFRITSSNKLYWINLEKHNDSCYFLVSSSYQNNKKIINSRYKLNYPICHFEIGDINNDGQDDIAVGVIKSTFYDRIVRKRPFFYSMQDGNIIKLWMGTRLSQPLYDFRIVRENNTNYLQSIEIEKDGKYLVVQYIWNGFGFRFCKYLGRELILSGAIKMFKNQ